MIVADSSIWIDYLKGGKNKKMNTFHFHLHNNDIALIPTIMQEVLQGFRYEKEAEKLKKEMLQLFILPLDPVTAAIQAAGLNRSLRAKGITIRKSQDCLIAYYCLHFDLPILYLDKDFDFISKEFPLRTIE
ncbi:MAG TPA: PIN domain-containing protein [Cytophagales bacterium]|nr:PIN domain-containing protein [Cytophagales bacterium]